MASYFSRVYNYFAEQKEVQLVLVGNENVGKTTIYDRLTAEGTVQLYSGHYFASSSAIKYRNVKLTFYDLWPATRQFRHHYFIGSQVMFVIDSSSRENLGEAKDDLTRLLYDAKLEDAVFLILANKQDLPNAMTAVEITDELQLDEYRNRSIYIQATSALTGSGLYEGLDWLLEQLKNKN